MPLLIVLLGWGDDLPTFFAERAALDLLNEGFVVLLGQKGKRDVEGHRDERHKVLLVDGENRCDRQPMTTCELHDRVREDLRDDDRDPGLFPGGRIESKGENFRLLVWVPGRSAVDEFSSESDRPDRPLFTVPAMRKVLLDARMAMGQPRFPLSALEDLVRADAEASVPRFKKAIALLQDAKQSNNELVSAFARHRLEVSPPPQLDEAISTAQLQGGRVRSTLERLKREVNAAPAWVERVKFELDALGD